MNLKWLYDYNDFSRDYSKLNEGLIKSTSIDVVLNDLKKSNFSSTISIDISNNYKFELKFSDIDNIENDIYLLNTNISIFGYYISYYIIVLKNKITLKDIYFKEEFNDVFIKNIDNISELTFTIETKFNRNLYNSDIIVPDILYHIAAKRYKENILNNGLIPKSNSRKSFHPDRIYLFTDISKKNILANQFSNYDFNYYNSQYKDRDIFLKKFDIKNYYSNFYKYMLIKINCIELKNTLVLNTDPNFDDGYYTYDNIYPKFLDIIEENL